MQKNQSNIHGNIQIAGLVIAFLVFLISFFGFHSQFIAPLRTEIDNNRARIERNAGILRDLENVKDSIKEIRSQIEQLELFKETLEIFEDDLGALKKEGDRTARSKIQKLQEKIGHLNTQLKKHLKLEDDMRRLMVEWDESSTIPDVNKLLELELRRTIVYLENVNHCYVVAIASYRAKTDEFIAKQLKEFKIKYGGSELIGLMSFIKEGEPWYAIIWGHYETSKEASQDMRLVNSLFDVDSRVINITSGLLPCKCETENAVN